MDQLPKHPKVAKIFAELLAVLDTTATKLARDISRDGEDYKQQTISNYVAGKFLPGQEILAAIARQYPAINYKWLVTAEGEPFPNGRYNEKPAPKEAPASTPVEPEPPVGGMVAMVASTALDDMTDAQRADYYKLRYEKTEHKLTRVEKQLADVLDAQEHAETVQLVAQAGGRPFSPASPDAADESEPPFMVAVTNPNYAEAPEPSRRRIGYVLKNVAELV